MEWYVIQVMTGKEQAVADDLQLQGDVRPLVPLVVLPEMHGGKWSLKERTLFPGYVFVGAELTPERYYRIKGVANVIRFLGMATGKPAAVPANEMNPWLEICRVNPLPVAIGVKRAGRTHILDGPLARWDHRIRSVDTRQRRAKIDLEILGEHHTISVGIDVIGSSGSAAGDQSPRARQGEQRAAIGQNHLP